LAGIENEHLYSQTLDGTKKLIENFYSKCKKKKQKTKQTNMNKNKQTNMYSY